MTRTRPPKRSFFQRAAAFFSSQAHAPEASPLPRGAGVSLVLATLGLADVLLLLEQRRHPDSLSGLCGPRGGCERVLSSDFASIHGVSLVHVGLAFYATVILLLLLALSSGGPVRSLALRCADLLGLGATLCSGALLYVEIAVIRAICPLCTISAFVAPALYIVTGRVRRGPKAPGNPRAALFAATVIATIVLLESTVLAIVREERIVARIDGRDVSAHELSRALELPLYEIELEAYHQKMAWLERRVTDAILDDEARRRGISRDVLLATEVDAKIAPPSEADVAARAASHARTGTPSTATAEAARAEILAERRRERLRAFEEPLRAGHRVELFLDPPRSPIVRIDPSLGQRLGPASAPVRLAVFSDFACPYCAELAAVLAHIRERFRDDVSLTFRHFPLERHASARPAAELAERAAALGRFWECHDLLFARMGRLDAPALLETERLLGLDATTTTDPQVRGAIEASLSEGNALGIDSVPALFLNGRLVGGRIPEEELERLIDDELVSRTSLKTAARAAPPGASPVAERR